MFLRLVLQAPAGPTGGPAPDPFLDFLQRLGGPLLIASALTLAAYWGLIQLHRLVRVYKIRSKRSPWLDSPSLEYIEASVRWSVGYGLVLAAVWLFSAQDPATRRALGDPVFAYAGYLTVLLVIWVAVGTMVRIWHRVMSYWGGSLPFRPARPMTPQTAFYVEAPVKYTLLITAVTVSFLAVLGIISIAFSLHLSEDILHRLGEFVTLRSGDLAFLIIFLLVAAVVLRLVEVVLEDIKVRRIAASPRIVDLGRTAFRYVWATVVSIITIYTLLQVFGLQPTGLVLVAVIIFVLAVGAYLMISSPSFRNVMSGLALLSAQPFREGDRVRIGDQVTGEVREVGPVYTLLETSSGELLHIPNNEVVEARITNLSRGGHVGLGVTVRVPLTISGERVEELLLAAAGDTEGLSDTPEAEVFAVGIAKGSAVYELVCSTASHHHLRRIESRLLHRIHRVFLEASIEVEAAVSETDSGGGPAGGREGRAGFWSTHARGAGRPP